MCRPICVCAQHRAIKEQWVRLGHAKIRRCNKTIRMIAQPQFVPQILRAQIFLIGGKENFDTLVTQRPQIVQNTQIQPRIIGEPIVN